MFKGGVYGVISVIVFSAILSPFICIAISSNVDVICNFGYNSKIFFNIYSNPYSLLLIFLGGFLGAMVGRAILLIKNKADILDRQEYLKNKNRKFLWMWERK